MKQVLYLLVKVVLQLFLDLPMSYTALRSFNLLSKIIAIIMDGKILVNSCGVILINQKGEKKTRRL